MNYVTRAEWGARPPRSTASFWGRLGYAVHYTAGAAPWDEAAEVRATQQFHMNARGWSDIAYNWLVGQSGTIYEGRGWTARSAAQGTAYGNRYYGAVCWLGGPGDVPTRDALAAIADVVRESRRLGFGTGLHPHNWFKSTACPGATLDAWVRGGDAEALIRKEAPVTWTKPGDPVQNVADAKAVNAYQGGSVWSPHDIDYDENDPTHLDERHKVITARIVDLLMQMDIRSHQEHKKLWSAIDAVGDQAAVGASHDHDSILAAVAEARGVAQGAATQAEDADKRVTGLLARLKEAVNKS